MSVRAKKFLAMWAILAFVIVYAIVFATIGNYVPDLWWAQMIYYIAAGSLWGAPLVPLFRWMHRAR